MSSLRHLSYIFTFECIIRDNEYINKWLYLKLKAPLITCNIDFTSLFCVGKVEIVLSEFSILSSHLISSGKSDELASPIWLLFNPKHPIVREYIWKLVLAEIQETLYIELQARMDTSKLCIRNAVNNIRIVPDTLHWWNTELSAEMALYRELVQTYQPKIIISFGSFPFEFVRRVFKMKPEKGPKFWGVAKLGEEFRKSINEFDVTKTNIIPLLRRMTECEKFIGDHSSEDYYHYVGTTIAKKIIENKASFNHILMNKAIE